MDTKKLLAACDKIIAGFQEIKLAFQGDAQMQSQSVPSTPTPTDDLVNFEKLRATLETDRWPTAVNKNLICNPEIESNKLERGRGILELQIEEDLQDLKFLDYGCGQGHTAWQAANRARTSIGYDPQEQPWGKLSTKPNLVLTKDWSVVTTYAPFDIVLIFDVIDHLVETSPTEALSQIASVLADGGKIYMRTHPHTSRDATHLYHDLNKAFLHLVFTPDELKQILPTPKYCEPSLKMRYPLKTYEQYISAANLKVLSRREIKSPVEPFFRIPQISDRIMRNLETKDFPEFQMSMCFIDYCLIKK